MAVKKERERQRDRQTENVCHPTNCVNSTQLLLHIHIKCNHFNHLLTTKYFELSLTPYQMILILAAAADDTMWLMVQTRTLKRSARSTPPAYDQTRVIYNGNCNSIVIN